MRARIFFLFVHPELLLLRQWFAVCDCRW